MAASPKLVVAIVVDQMRYDYLERFHDQFTTNGLRLLTDQGAFMTFARYDYCPTVTGPGHASIFAGAPPAVHGIIGNDWFDKRLGKTINCVEDSSVTGVGTATNKSRVSPRNLIGDTFADQFRLRYRSKVVGISMKDRGAILPAGRNPTGAYWFEGTSGNFVTSSYYMSELPTWVEKFNARRRVNDFADATWDRLLDKNAYHSIDRARGEGTLNGEKDPVFPHKLIYKTNSFEDISITPFAHQLLAEFAQAAIEGEHLGSGPEPDLLCISFSGLDAVGHRFGPYSQEVQDMVLRLDRDVASLFSYIDQRLGLANVVMMLTADHGVAPVPEFASENGLPAERYDMDSFAKELATSLSQEFGAGSYFVRTNLYYGSLYYNHATLRARGVTPERVSAFIRERALDTGIFQAVFSREQLLDGRAPGWIGHATVNGYNAERSGDVVLITKPYVLPGTGKTGTTHGTPYSYDTQIPVLFYGAAFKPGRYADEFYITDIAPTLCSALRINTPAGAVGQPFVKALNQN